MTFAKPSSSTGIEWADLKGALLIVKPLEYVASMKTVHGENPAVRADVIVIDDKGSVDAGTEYLDTLIFPKVLQSQVKASIGGMVLGRLGQGVAKPAQSKPWLLAEATEADLKVGNDYIAANTKLPF